jgi:hypothetical protein
MGCVVGAARTDSRRPPRLDLRGSAVKDNISVPITRHYAAPATPKTRASPKHYGFIRYSHKDTRGGCCWRLRDAHHSRSSVAATQQAS